jgi:hypothetical protein
MGHAKFSPSGSHKWTNCPGSLKLEEKAPSVESSFSTEGVLAHEIAYKLAIGTISENDLIFVSDEILDAAKKYVNYIENLIVDDSSLCFYEKIVFFGDLLSVDNNQAFGTVDCLIYNEDKNEIHVVDFKYGKGIRVDAEKNTQLLLYAIGAYQELLKDKEILKITLHIVQPRLDHFDSYSLSLEDLMGFWVNYFKVKIAQTKDSYDVFNPSPSVCRFCRAKPICPALYKKTINLDLKIKEKSDIEEIKESQIKEILINADLIIDYLNSVKEYVYNKAINEGSFAGHKLVKGRVVRKIKEELIPDLEYEIGVELYKKTLLGVGEIEKILKSFNREIKDFVTFVDQKAILVEEHDKRTLIN